MTAKEVIGTLCKDASQDEISALDELIVEKEAELSALCYVRECLTEKKEAKAETNGHAKKRSWTSDAVMDRVKRAARYIADNRMAKAVDVGAYLNLTGTTVYALLAKPYFQKNDSGILSLTPEGMELLKG
jgi:hypothetical protein